MRNLLILSLFAAFLLGCSNPIGRRSAFSPPSSPGHAQYSVGEEANTAPRNLYARRAYREQLAFADSDDDPAFERRRARRAYREQLAFADSGDDVSDFQPRRAWQPSARPDQSRAFSQGPSLSDGSGMEGYPAAMEGYPAAWRQDPFPRRSDQPAQADDSDDEEGFFGDRGDAGQSVNTSLPPGFKTITLQQDGRERSYLLYVPTHYRAGQSTPLVLVFHGGGGNAYSMARKTRMDRLAEQHHFIVIYPNGTGAGGRRLTWNAGSNPPQGYAEKQRIDDIGFVSRILQQMQQQYSINPKRIYATGHSKGGMFSYRLACQLSDQIAAIAPVSGALTYAQCHPSSVVAVLHIHGSNDENVPFQGGRGAFSAQMASYPSALQGIDQWRQHNNCAAIPTQTAVTSDTNQFAYKGCQSGGDVTYYVVRGGGHGWPGSTPTPRQQERGIYVSNQLKASEEIWKFFATHPKL